MLIRDESISSFKFAELLQRSIFTGDSVESVNILNMCLRVQNIDF